MELQRAKFTQGEQFGKPVEAIEGIKPPVKINLGKNFMKEEGCGLIKDLKREFISKGARKSANSIDRNK